MLVAYDYNPLGIAVGCLNIAGNTCGYQMVAVRIFVTLLLFASAPPVFSANTCQDIPEGKTAASFRYLIDFPKKEADNERVIALEKYIRYCPNHLTSRLELLRHYSPTNVGRGGMFDAIARSILPNGEFLQHLLWLIEHHPTEDFFRRPIVFGPVNSALSDMSIDAIHTAWKKQIAKHPKNADVLYNASYFYPHKEREQSITALQKALELKPSSEKITRLSP